MKKQLTKKCKDFYNVNESFMKRSEEAGDTTKAPEPEDLSQDLVDAASTMNASCTGIKPEDEEDADDINQHFSTSSEQPPTVVGL